MNSTEIDDKNTFVISSDQIVKLSDFGGGGIARLVYDGKELAILDRADVVKIARSELTTRFIEFSEVDW
jgi:NAD kinase